MNLKRIAALMLGVCMVLSLAACGGTAAEETAGTTETMGIAVQVIDIETGDIAAENKVSGTISADNATTIMIPATAKCTAVYARAGDTVEAGDIICTLELGSSLASYSAARIGYDSAVQSYQDQKGILDKQVSLAADNVENTKALFEIGAASQLEVDQAELNYQTAVAGRNSALAQLEAGIQNAKSGLEQLDVVLENVDAAGNVIAPQAGTLTTMNAVENSFVSNAMPLAVIDGAAQMKVIASVSETLVPKLSIGDIAEVSVSSANQTFEAAIRAVERSANMQTKLYTVTLTIPEDVEGLLSGMFADVTFRTDASENTVVVPTEAILTSNGIQYVYVVEEGVAKYVEVTTGLDGSGVTEIVSGLSAGQQLVTVGQAYLKDGAAVRVVGEG